MTGFGLQPFGVSEFGGAPAAPPVPQLPSATPVVPQSWTAVHLVHTVSGRILATLDGNDLPESAPWTETLNQSGTVSATIPEAVIRKYNLRDISQAWRCSLAIEQDGRIKQAGPILSRPYNWRDRKVDISASGIWRWFDQRIVSPAVLNASKPAASVFTVVNRSLGGIAVELAARALAAPYASLPIVLPAAEAGDHIESFPAFGVLRCGEQLRQITQRAVDAPDIRFDARRRQDDPRYIEWVMKVGTDLFPSLSQGGPDWVFDATVPKSPVRGVTTDEDGTDMATQVWGTGNGMEEDILLSIQSNPELTALDPAAAWPLLESSDSWSTVEVQATLDSNTAQRLSQWSRPIEVYKVTVSADAAREVHAGDYCRLITKDDPWVGTMDKTMRVRQVSGDLSDEYVLEMFPAAAAL